jgi:3-dehydroquinate dehydratase-2
MKLMVINGANLNLLGTREPEIYGKQSLIELEWGINNHAEKYGAEVACFQFNSESGIIETIHSALKYRFDGIIINAGGFSHTSVSILDALKGVNIPYAEVHMSNVEQRESFRKIDFLKDSAAAYVSGQGAEGYLTATKMLLKHIRGIS